MSYRQATQLTADIFYWLLLVQLVSGRISDS